MAENDKSWSREDDVWRKTTSPAAGRQVQMVWLVGLVLVRQKTGF